MNNKSAFRLVSIGFLSGVCISGLIFLIINAVQNHHQQIYSLQVATVESSGATQNKFEPQSGKLNVNQATISEFVSLPGIGESKAMAIIDFREKYGHFEDISELSYVPGIGNTLLESIQDLVIID